MRLSNSTQTKGIKYTEILQSNFTSFPTKVQPGNRKLKLQMDWKNGPFANWILVKREVEAWRSLFREERVNSKSCKGRFWDHFYSESITDDLEKDSDDTKAFEFSPNQLLVCQIVSFMVPSATALLFPGSPLHHRLHTNEGKSMGERIVQHKFKELCTHLSQFCFFITYALDFETEAYIKWNRFPLQVLMSNSTWNCRSNQHGIWNDKKY